MHVNTLAIFCPGSIKWAGIKLPEDFNKLFFSGFCVLKPNCWKSNKQGAATAGKVVQTYAEPPRREHSPIT